MADEFLTDWANLPVGVDPISIWDSVHDGELLKIQSDILARTLSVNFAVPYLVSFHNLPEDLTFTFWLEGVQCVRALRYSVWPGALTIPTGTPYAEVQRLHAEHRSKWRQESESWEKFEGVASSDDEAELTDGDLVSGRGGATALRLGVQMGNGEWYEVFIRAENLAIRRSDGGALSIEEFLELGSAYWEAFAKRKVPTNK